MKKRPRFLKHVLTPSQRAMRKMRRDIYEDLLWYGTAGTKTWLDEKGEVHVRRMTYSELCRVQEMVATGKEVPEEFTLLNNHL